MIGVGIGLTFAHKRVSSPLDLMPANLKLWLRADSLSATPVASWQDKRGGSNPTFAQATELNKPAWSATSMNGKPGVTFDGTSDFLNTTESISPLGNDTIFLVVDADTTPNTNAYLLDSQTGRLVLYHNDSVGGDLFFSGAADSGTIAVTDTAPISLSFVLNSAGGNSAAVYKNGTLVEGGLPYTQVAIGTNTALGRSYSGAFNWFKGVVAEVIIYNAVLSTTQRKQIEAYLKSRYGL